MRNTQNEIPWILFNNKQFFRVKSRKFSFSENLNHVEGIFKHEKNYVFHSDIFFLTKCLSLSRSLAHTQHNQSYLIWSVCQNRALVESKGATFVPRHHLASEQISKIEYETHNSHA